MSTQLTPSPDKGMSLYRIDDTLAQLISLRGDMVQDAATDDDLAVVDQQIREYMLVELPKKVASTCAIFRMWKGQRAVMKAERERIQKLERAMEEREERLKGYVAEILERQPMPAKGCRKLEGADGSKLMLKGNGGVQPLTVDTELLPTEYFDVVVRMPASTWELMKFLTESDKLVYEVLDVSIEELSREPSNVRIREALVRECTDCGGTGAQYEIPESARAAGYNPMDCPACGGTGKLGVPGASLGERGQHVEVK